MTVYTVGEGRDFAAINPALAAAQPGDTVVVRGGVYHEALVLSTPGVSVIAVPGEMVTIDGRYSPALFGDGNYAMSNGRTVGAGQLPSLSADNARRGGWVYSGKLSVNGYSSLVRLAADGTSVTGLTLRNSAGRFIVIEGDDCLAEYCRLDFCYGGAVSVARGSVGAKMRGLTITRSSMKHFDVGAPGAGPDAVATTVIVQGTDVLIEGCTVCYNYGEGISADKGSIRPVIRGNICHTNYHWSLGFNNTDGAVIDRNIVYWCDNLTEAMDKQWPADGFVGGSERASAESPKEARTPNTAIVGNLFVGYLKRAWLLGGTGRPVQFVDSRVEDNTIVGRVTFGEVRPAFTWTALKAALHENTTVCGNVIVWQAGGRGISYQPGGGVLWRDNLYSEQPPAGMRGEADVVTREPALVNPFAVILGQYDAYALDMPDVTTTFDLGNYRPLALGPAVGRGALDVLPSEPPDEPEPPERVPDWERMLSLLASAEVAVVGMAGLLHEIDGRMTALHEARAGVAASMNELTVLIESEKER